MMMMYKHTVWLMIVYHLKNEEHEDTQNVLHNSRIIFLLAQHRK